MEDDVVAVGAARVRPHGAQGKMETLAAGVPLDGDRAALGCAIAQHQLTVIIQPHLWEDAQVRRHIWRARQQSQHAGILDVSFTKHFLQKNDRSVDCKNPQTYSKLETCWLIYNELTFIQDQQLLFYTCLSLQMTLLVPGSAREKLRTHW